MNGEKWKLTIEFTDTSSNKYLISKEGSWNEGQVGSRCCIASDLGGLLAALDVMGVACLGSPFDHAEDWINAFKESLVRE